MTARSHAAASFTWNARDVGHAHLIAHGLDTLGRFDLGDQVRAASINLQRPEYIPSVADAWAFFAAARALDAYRHDTNICAQARALGSRIGLHATGLTVVDAMHGQCGATDGYAVLHHGKLPCLCTVEHGNRDCAHHGGDDVRRTRWEVTDLGLHAALVAAIASVADSDQAATGAP